MGKLEMNIAYYGITFSILALTIFCAGRMLVKLKKEPPLHLSFSCYAKLIVSGIVAFIADTVGIGSFAVNTALAKMLGTFTDDELPAVNNGAQVIPGAIESLFFLQLVDVDLKTLLTLVAGTCIGGLLGGFIVSKLSKQAIRLAMVVCFAGVIMLLVAHKLQLLPVVGELTVLRSWHLVIGFFALLACGALTSVGIGLFVMVQAVLFIMNVSPIIAFPIMTIAGAMQQPLTTLVFLQNNKIPLKKTLILSGAGCLGVCITLPLFKHLTISWLHLLLLGILIYNFFAISRTYLQSRAYAKKEHLISYSLAAK